MTTRWLLIAGALALCFNACSSDDSGGATGSCLEENACKQSGQCTPQNDNECVATSEEQCVASWDCQEWGKCSLNNGECVVGKDADCNFDYCDHDNNGVYVCRGCAIAGECTAKDGKCVAGKAADC